MITKGQPEGDLCGDETVCALVALVPPWVYLCR